MLTNKSTCELAVHFNKEEHHMSEFIVIEKIVNESDNITSIGVCSIGRLFGARNYVLFSLMDWAAKDPNLILRREFGLINSLFQFVVVTSKS